MNNLVNGIDQRRGMFDEWMDQRATMRAWEDFLTFRDPARSQISGVRREILESWTRSLASGIVPTGKAAPLGDVAAEPEHESVEQVELRKAAELPFAKIGALLSESNALLILTDRKGLVLEQIGDERTQNAARDINLRTGGKWCESAIGTNAIGTSIRTGSPTVVHASEHFCEGVKAWTCAAAPIHCPFGRRLLGVVDLSGPPGIFRPHNVAMVSAVAREIESNLAERQEARRTRLLEAFLDSGAALSSRDPVVILDQIGRVIYHRVPSIGTGSGAARDLVLGRQLVALTRSMSDQEIARAMPQHLRPTGINRLHVDGEFGGAVLVLPATERGTRSAPVPVAPSLRVPAREGGPEIVMVGQDPKFLEAVELARRAAEAGVSILVQGETGTGKELFARLVHARAKHRGKGPFVTLNCGAISPELFGAELFGHVAGAFTGALREGKPGKLEQADGGTLCLDEIGEMPLDLQPFLLRVLEQRAVYRIGCSRRRAVDVQVIAMTNRDLRQEVEAGRFRRDLYYRIGAVTIEAPALRQRAGDIPALAAHFNSEVALRFGSEPLVLSECAIERMQSYHWPGNVREMRNLFERLHVRRAGTAVTGANLPDVMQSAPSAASSPATAEPESLSDAEERAIRRALVTEDGNLTRVAAVLGISRPTLYRKLKAYGIRRNFQ